MTHLEGIDISHWQARTPPLTDAIEFVFARATYGLFPDTKWTTHAANVRRAGKVLGAYAFGRYGSGKAQANALLNVVGSLQLVALDFEPDRDNPHMTPGQAREFIRTVQSSGRKCGLYASDSGFPYLGQDWNWVAKWGTVPPTRPWAFWQYRGTPLDRDRFKGTLDQLHALAGYPVAWEVDIAAGTRFATFEVSGDLITATHYATTPGGVHAPCSAPNVCHYRSGAKRSLVKITSGPRKGDYVSRKWAHQ